MSIYWTRPSSSNTQRQRTMEFEDIAGLLEEKAVLRQKEENSNDCKQTGMTSLPSLLPNLPDDVAMQCLGRLPYCSRAIASCVCRRWKQVLQPHSIQPIRQALNITPEVWVFICLDKRLCLIEPFSMRTKLIPFPDGLSFAYFRTAVSVGGDQKLIFFGLNHLDALLCCYDIAAESWRISPPMHVKRWGFACARLGKYVYVAGGFWGGERFRSAERFDMENNVWEGIPPMNRQKVDEVGFVMDDRFYVMGTYSLGKVSLEYFDPQMGGWTVVPNNRGKSLPPFAPVQTVERMLSVAVVRNNLYLRVPGSTLIVTLSKDTHVWETFDYCDEPSVLFSTEILGVGDKIWKITHYRQKVKILSCRPAVKPLKWSRVQLGLNKHFKSSGSCTTFSIG